MNDFTSFHLIKNSNNTYSISAKSINNNLSSNVNLSQYNIKINEEYFTNELNIITNYFNKYKYIDQHDLDNFLENNFNDRSFIYSISIANLKLNSKINKVPIFRNLSNYKNYDKYNNYELPNLNINYLNSTLDDSNIRSGEIILNLTNNKDFNDNYKKIFELIPDLSNLIHKKYTTPFDLIEIDYSKNRYKHRFILNYFLFKILEDNLNLIKSPLVDIKYGMSINSKREFDDFTFRRIIEDHNIISITADDFDDVYLNNINNIYHNINLLNKYFKSRNKINYNYSSKNLNYLNNLNFEESNAITINISDYSTITSLIKDIKKIKNLNKYKISIEDGICTNDTLIIDLAIAFNLDYIKLNLINFDHKKYDRLIELENILKLNSDK